MSGGVDSSVVAARVAAAGIPAFGITLAMWPSSREMVRDRGCCSIDAVDDARRVAAAVGLDHYVWNLERDFAELVVAEFEEGYAAGNTPNPCVRCNERVKFGVLLERAMEAGASHVATGHYARTGFADGEWTLHRALDGRRDQSYVLHRLAQEQLSRAVFPLGSHETKQEVRAEAHRLGLHTAAKPESQDLCFVDGRISEHLSTRLAGRFQAGPVVSLDGREVGRHRGLPFHTVGQRSGLGLQPLTPDARPSYVIEVRPADNTIVVGPREALTMSRVEVASCSWTSGRPPQPAQRCAVQLRAHGEALPATVAADSGGGAHIRLDSPASRVAPGQAAVLYDGDRVLGGGSVTGAA
ncbi:MAG: tRNA 2-thiouridine(34) synthase MnmA [Candidatus Dormibacteraeota bacterium]|nr:tRNA 2-thiouridine(34) synthase MnmA [Candidatus Dormibacteraeota bacterium]